MEKQILENEAAMIASIVTCAEEFAVENNGSCTTIYASGVELIKGAFLCVVKENEVNAEQLRERMVADVKMELQRAEMEMNGNEC